MSKTKHPITDELLDQLLANYQKPEDLIGAEGILKQLTKTLVELALDAEVTQHLGHDKHQPGSNPAVNTRNGFSRKKLKGDSTVAIHWCFHDGLLFAVFCPLSGSWFTCILAPCQSGRMHQTCRVLANRFMRIWLYHGSLAFREFRTDAAVIKLATGYA